MAVESDPSAPQTPSGTAASATTRGGPNIRYVDRPEISETFADTVSGVTFDGQTLRLEFAVTRLDEVRPNTPISGRRYPTCRVVLPPTAAVDLINRMQQVATALTQAGVARAAPRGDGPTG